MTTQEKWDKRFLDLAALVAGWSKDPSTKTGAVIVDDSRRVISVGYNGFPQRMPDFTALYEDREQKYSRIVHCEVNALLFARGSVNDCTLYTYPFMSCDRCVVQMLQAGIGRFVAPKPTEDALTRWGDAFARTKKYILECAALYKEY